MRSRQRLARLADVSTPAWPAQFDDSHRALVARGARTGRRAADRGGAGARRMAAGLVARHDRCCRSPPDSRSTGAPCASTLTPAATSTTPGSSTPTAARATCCSESIRTCSPIRRRRRQYRARHLRHRSARRRDWCRRSLPARDGAAAVSDDSGDVSDARLRRGTQPRRTRVGGAGVGGGRRVRPLPARARALRSRASTSYRFRIFTNSTWQLRTVRSRAANARTPSGAAPPPTTSTQAQRDRARVIAESLGPRGMIHGDGKVTNLLFDDDGPRRARCSTSTP